HLRDLPRRVAELKDVAGHALDGKILVQRSDERVFGLEHDAIVGDLGHRCAHRGALIALDDGGSTGRRFQCVYHAWSYDLEGSLVSVAFEKGANGKGGMPASFCKAEHAPRRLRTATLGGLVFATLDPAAPPLDAYLGEAVRARLLRVLSRPVQVLGRFVQALPN